MLATRHFSKQKKTGSVANLVLIYFTGQKEFLYLLPAKAGDLLYTCENMVLLINCKFLNSE